VDNNLFLKYKPPQVPENNYVIASRAEGGVKEPTNQQYVQGSGGETDYNYLRPPKSRVYAGFSR